MSSERAIVFGAPRSGTSFLMRALEALPESECVSGNLLPVGIAHLAAQELPDDMREALQRSFSGSLTDYLSSAVYRSRSAAVRKWWISGRRPARLGDAARARRAETMVIYKEPFLAFAPAFAYEALPGARLIYLFRDGRDVADSLVRSYDVLSDRKLLDLATNEVMLGRRSGDRFVPWWVQEGEDGAFLEASQYVRAVWMWREMVRRSREFLARADVEASGRVLPVRYEELMGDPPAQGDAIVRHLRQPSSPAMRKQLHNAHSRSVGIHARREPEEILAAETLAGAELEALGYALQASSRL
jgi:Sulfotransferase family